MHENVAVVIPALESNQYYPDGDLISFGDNTLLEWKISQVMEVAENENIFISTPSDKIIQLAKELGLNFIKRNKVNDPSVWIPETVESIEREIIMWTHATSPFISPGDYRLMLEKFFSLSKGYDSLVTVYKEPEYFFFNGKTLNFDINNYKVRKEIDPVYRITNGCYITPRESYRQNRKYFGQSPFLYEVDKMAALEIKDIDHYEMVLNLLSLYFKVKES
ncbi:MAG: hypothetical protein HOJ13_02785 [Nitrospina sp.]|nr:hypothetical protein [Nitrospina sp.]